MQRFSYDISKSVYNSSVYDATIYDNVSGKSYDCTNDADMVDFMALINELNDRR